MANTGRIYSPDMLRGQLEVASGGRAVTRELSNVVTAFIRSPCGLLA